MQSESRTLPGWADWREWQAEGSRSQRIDYWRSIVCEAVVDAEMMPADARQSLFTGNIQSLNQAGARFVSFRSSPHRIARTSKHVARSDHGFVMLGLQRHGRSRVAQAGAEVDLNPGDIGIVDSAQPFELRFPDAIERRIVMVPKGLLSGHVQLGDLTRGAVKVSSDHPFAPLLGQFIQTLTARDKPLGSPQVHLLLSGLVDYLAESIRPDRGGGEAGGAGRSSFDNLIEHVQAHLTSPELSASSAALDVGVSLRSVHRLFRRFADCTFEQYVIAQRLQLARQLLLSGAAPTVSDAAFSTGFNDLSHFSRRFVAAFGERPSSLIKTRPAG